MESLEGEVNRTCGDREPASDKQVSVRIRILSYVNKHTDVRDAFARGILSVFRSLFPSLRTRKLGTATPQPISTSINQGGRGEWSNPRLTILNNMKQPCTGRKDTKITQVVKHKGSATVAAKRKVPPATQLPEPATLLSPVDILCRYL